MSGFRVVSRMYADCEETRNCHFRESKVKALVESRKTEVGKNSKIVSTKF